MAFLFFSFLSKNHVEKRKGKEFLLSFKRRLNTTCGQLKKTRLKTTIQTTKKKKKKKKKKKDAAREQGSGPPETRMGEDTGRHDALFFLSSSRARDFENASSSSFFKSDLKKKALLRVLSARKLTRCILRSLSLSLSATTTTTTNQTGIQKLKNLLDNKNGANGEEPQGFDATEFMGHYT